VRGGGTPFSWSRARTRQIDRDGRWMIKRGRKRTPPPGEVQSVGEIVTPVFGFKDYLGIYDAKGRSSK